MPQEPQQPKDHIALAIIDGVRYKAKVQQFGRAAYVTVWGAGDRCWDAAVQVADVRKELGRAIRGESELHPDHVGVLSLAAWVFALAEAQAKHHAARPIGKRSMSDESSQ